MSLFIGAHADYSLPRGLLVTTAFAEKAIADDRSFTAALFHSIGRTILHTKKSEIEIFKWIHINLGSNQSYKCRNTERDHSRRQTA